MKLALETMNPFLTLKNGTARYIRTARYGIETAAFVDSRMWSHMHSELK